MTRITAPNAGCFGARAAVTIPFLQCRRAGPVNQVLGHRGFQDKSRSIAVRWYDDGIGGDVVSESTHLKDEAHKLVEQLPDDATWADLLRLVAKWRVWRASSWRRARSTNKPWRSTSSLGVNWA